MIFLMIFFNDFLMICFWCFYLFIFYFFIFCFYDFFFNDFHAEKNQKNIKQIFKKS